MKKVISYSLWGRNKIYTIGALKNLKLAKKVFPDWICRFYIDSSVPNNILNKMRVYKNCEIVNVENILKKKKPLININKVLHQQKSKKVEGWYGMLWRILVMVDPEVSYFLLRDCDSRLNWREKGCIDNFIKNENKYDYFAMQEKEEYGRTMVGLFGGKANRIPEFKKLLNNILKDTDANNSYGCDEEFCRLNIYSKIGKRKLLRFSYYPKNDKICRCCSLKRDKKCKIADEVAFPKHKKLIKGMGQWVGQSLDENDKISNERMYKKLLANNKSLRKMAKKYPL